MAPKYLDETGLAYFWSKIKGYLATTTHSGLMSPEDKAKVDAITSQGTVAYYRKLESTYTTTGSISTIPIGITGLSTADMLMVDVDGWDFIEGVNYTRSGTNIVLTDPITEAGHVVHFVALRAVTASVSDYSVLKGDPGPVGDVLLDGTSVLDQRGYAILDNLMSTVTPKVDLSNYQVSGSVDKELYDAIVALGWLSECFANGKLKLKEWMTKVNSLLMPIETTVSLSTNDFNIYANQVVKQGSMVFVSITATTKKSYANQATMFNLPYRASGRSDMYGLDAGQNRLYAFYTASGSKTVNNNSGRTINSGETFFLKGFYYTDE